MTGEKCERKKQKEKSKSPAQLCLLPSKLNIRVGEEALHLIQLELNGVDVCCSVESSFVESMCLVGEPE